MRLYLVQHGEAVPKEQDADRPLSAAGRADVERLAAFLRISGIRVHHVLHSGKTRAEQTAQCLAGAVMPEGAVRKTLGMGPKDPVAPFEAQSQTWTEDAMLVGHLPFMGRLAARLVTGDEQIGVTLFQPGSVVCLERLEAGQWGIAWMLRPELLADQDTP